LQAQPHDPENFPFVVLGNKIDEDDGKSRQVIFFFFLSSFLSAFFLSGCDGQAEVQSVDGSSYAGVELNVGVLAGTPL
jgi:hypothetical protein